MRFKMWIQYVQLQIFDSWKMSKSFWGWSNPLCFLWVPWNISKSKRFIDLASVERRRKVESTSGGKRTDSLLPSGNDQSDDISMGLLSQFSLCSLRWDFVVHQSSLNILSSTLLQSENPPKAIWIFHTIQLIDYRFTLQNSSVDLW